VYDRFRAVCPGIPFERFYAAFTEGYRDVEQIRAREHREVPSEHRFRLVLAKLRLHPRDLPPGFAEWLAEVHMSKLSEAMVFPPEHRPLLEWASSHYRLAIVSNFDHTPTARRLLRRHGILDHFEQVVVSAEEGVRKPHPEIFRRTLSRIGLSPREALFIGDSPALDIAGAKGVGMDVVWVNREGAALRDGTPTPEYTISRLPELRSLLGRDT
jgi:FMN phosphatase YigB (HAD superfamily)